MRTLLGYSLLLPLIAAIGPADARGVRDADIDEVKAMKVKAAYLYNFGKFVEWPATAFEGPDSPFVIAVVGSDPFARILGETVLNKQIGDRAIRVLRLNSSDEADLRPLRRCHILFVPGGVDFDAKPMQRHCAGSAVLVVGDRDRFVAEGGMIGFVLEDGRIRFELCREALERAGLNASAQLLKLARLVEAPRR